MGKKVVVIGGYGHIGGFLVPRLVEAGYDVTVVTRGKKAPPNYPSWKRLSHKHFDADYNVLVRENGWKALLSDIKPAVVIDILCKNAPAVVDSCPASVKHVVITGSLWMYGPPAKVPTPEHTDALFPFEGYKERYKQLVELVTRRKGPAITAVMPSNIAGPGKIPLEPYGGRSIEVHQKMARGEEIVLPAGGNALVSPGDAEDIAEVFALAVERPDASAWKLFNAGSAYAITYNELVAVFGRCYGVTIPVRHGSWADFEAAAGNDPSQRYHHEAHMCPDISAARTLLGYSPKFTPETSIQRAVDWMRSEKLL